MSQHRVHNATVGINFHCRLKKLDSLRGCWGCSASQRRNQRLQQDTKSNVTQKIQHLIRYALQVKPLGWQDDWDRDENPKSRRDHCTEPSSRLLLYSNSHSSIQTHQLLTSVLIAIFCTMTSLQQIIFTFVPKKSILVPHKLHHQLRATWINLGNCKKRV